MTYWEDVVRKLEDARYKWRTVRGVAKELNASPISIQEILADHVDEIVKSSIPAESGEELYTTRRHYSLNASPLDRLTSGVSMSVSSSSSSSSSRSSSSSSSLKGVDQNE